MSSHGGSRAGAGRKRRSEAHAGPISEAERQIADRLPRLIDNLTKLADGVTVQAPNADGTLEVFTRPPDLRANTYLIDRVMGKPTERHEVTGEDGEPFKVYVGIDVDRV